MPGTPPSVPPMGPPALKHATPCISMAWPTDGQTTSGFDSANLILGQLSLTQDALGPDESRQVVFRILNDIINRLAEKNI